jgi:hypothetical protein
MPLFLGSEYTPRAQVLLVRRVDKLGVGSRHIVTSDLQGFHYGLHFFKFTHRHNTSGIRLG